VPKNFENIDEYLFIDTCKHEYNQCSRVKLFPVHLLLSMSPVENIMLLLTRALCGSFVKVIGLHNAKNA